MDEFENQNNNQSQGGNTNPPRPDYYRPAGENPQQTQNNGDTTYHYSYVKPDGQKGTQSSQQGAQNNSSSYYTPPQNNSNPNYSQNTNNTSYYTPPRQGQSPSGSYSPYGNYSSDNNAGGSGKPPKKSKAGIIIIVVLIICLVVAGIGLGIGAKGMLDGKEKESTTQSQGDSDAKLSDSEDVPLKDKENNYTVAGVAENCRDSCVGITVYTQQTSAYDYFFGYGQNNNTTGEPAKSGEGSGVLFSESNGKTYIITCAHVISDADEFKVTLDDGSEYDAQMVGVDAQTDIGVLSINKTGLKIADFADSSNVIVGEQVVAIGCPGGLEFLNSVSSGYVSALDRPISSSIGYNNECIQTDTAINPGNSGGALFNMQGQVIGINSSKIASTEYEGMGFAVPSKTAVENANSIIRVGYVEGRAKIGITYSPITSFNNSETIINALAGKGFKNAEGTMVIDEVDPSSDLAGKDVKSYDMIVAVNGKTMTSTDVMTSVLSDSKPGDTIKLTIARVEGEDIVIKEVDCKLMESKN